MKQFFVAGTVALAMSATPAFAQQSTQNPQPGQSGSGTTRQPGQTGSDTTRQPSGTSAQQSRSGEQAKSQFAMDAAHIHMAEIEMGKLAQQKGQSQQVKDFGERLEDDHSKSLDQLKDLADDKNIMLPTAMDAKHKATHDKLSKLSGAEFDRTFAQDMVNGHKEALQKAQAAAKSESDAEIKAYATKMVDSVQAHLKVAQSLGGSAVGTSGTQDKNDRQPQPQGAGQGQDGSRGGSTGGATATPGGSTNPGGATDQSGSDRGRR